MYVSLRGLCGRLGEEPEDKGAEDEADDGIPVDHPEKEKGKYVKLLFKDNKKNKVAV